MDAPPVETQTPASRTSGELGLNPDPPSIGRELEIELSRMAAPSPAVMWNPHWDRRRRVPIGGVEHLTELIAGLQARDWGGIQIPGSRGPWAQVKSGDNGEVFIELHPHTHEDQVGGMYFERVVDITANAAAQLGWNWVRRLPLPDGFVLEPRVVPNGQSWDYPL